MNCIAYKAGFKYQLNETAMMQTEIIPPRPVATEFIMLNRAGLLQVLEGYAWDGPSGPTIDRSSNMRGSLYHDALYQLMRLGLLDEDTYRPQADRLLKQVWIEDSMPRWLATVEVKMVNWFADGAGKHGTEKPVLYAPAKGL